MKCIKNCIFIVTLFCVSPFVSLNTTKVYASSSEVVKRQVACPRCGSVNVVATMHREEGYIEYFCLDCKWEGIDLL